MRLAQDAFGIRTRLENVTFRMKSIEGDGGRDVGEEFVGKSKPGDPLPDLARCILSIPPRIDRYSTIDTAPRRNGRGPISTFDLADVQIDRMFLIFKVRLPSLLFVPVRFQLSQVPNDAIGGIDCVGACAHL